MKSKRAKQENSWSNANLERDENGNLTPLAMALNAMSDYGCDCADDEPGTCLTCLCEQALRDMYMRLLKYKKNNED